jgi:hypothetical protein
MRLGELIRIKGIIAMFFSPRDEAAMLKRGLVNRDCKHKSYGCPVDKFAADAIEFTTASSRASSSKASVGFYFYCFHGFYDFQSKSRTPRKKNSGTLSMTVGTSTDQGRLSYTITHDARTYELQTTSNKTILEFSKKVGVWLLLVDSSFFSACVFGEHT